MKVLMGQISIDESISKRSNRYKEAIYHDHLSWWQLASHSERTNYYCGTFRSVAACENHPNELTVMGNSCNRLACKICGPYVAQKIAQKLSLKLWTIKNSLGRKGVYHWSINITDMESELTYREFKNYRRRLVRLLKDEGMEAAYLFFHPYRLKCPKCGCNMDKCKCKDTKFELFWSPHFHAIGFGKLRKSDEFYEKQGFTYRNEGIRKTANELKRTIAYILDHSAIRSQKPSYGHFGIKDNFIISTGKKFCECEICGNNKKVIDSNSIKITGKRPSKYYGLRNAERFGCVLEHSDIKLKNKLKSYVRLDKEFKIEFPYDVPSFTDKLLDVKILEVQYRDIKISSQIFDVPDKTRELIKILREKIPKCKFSEQREKIKAQIRQLELNWERKFIKKVDMFDVKKVRNEMRLLRKVDKQTYLKYGWYKDFSKKTDRITIESFF